MTKRQAPPKPDKGIRNKCDIENKISNETKRSDEGFLNLKSELSSLIDDKVGT
jgi:hypothetical protein